MTIERLLAVIEEAGISVDSRELADAIWLAAQITGIATLRPSSSSHRAEAATSEPFRPPPPPLPEGRTRQTPRAIPEPTWRQSRSPFVYATSGQMERVSQFDAIRFRSPGAAALPGTLGLLRALRPLKRNVPSTRLLVFDEEATADRVAADRLVLPVLRPGAERWLRLTLVVDSSRSMAIWDPLIAGLRTVFERLGAFRDVRVWYIDTNVLGKVSVFAHRTNDALQHSPAELIDPTGRQAILVVSDCIGDAWRLGTMSPVLDLWGHKGPLAILQPLPQRLWTRTALLPVPAELYARDPGSANHRYAVRSASDHVGLPIPLLEIEDEWLASWARLVSGAAERSAPVIATFTGMPVARELETTPDDRSATDRILQFQAGTTPQAFRLAGYLAFVPLVMPVMRLVQQAMLPGSRTSHLAEVFLSGLLRKTDATTGHPDRIVYDFINDEVRDALAGTVRRSEAIQVLEQVSRYLNSRVSGDADFDALMPASMGTGDLDLSSSFGPFGWLPTQISRRLGGGYAKNFPATTSSQYGGISTEDLLAPRLFRENVLVVHSTEDGDWAHRLAADLTRDDFRVSLTSWGPDTDDIKIYELSDALRRSDCFVLVYSRALANLPGAAERCAAMISVANETAKRFVPVLIDDIDPDPAVGSWIWADFRGPEWEQPYNALTEALGSLRTPSDDAAASGRMDEGLYVWTAADFQAGLEVTADSHGIDLVESGEPVDVSVLRQGRLPNLQQDFASLTEAFDSWLTPDRQRERHPRLLQVMWLVGDPTPERGKGLLACLSRAGRHGRAVHDANADLTLAARTLARSVIATSVAFPPLISVDLDANQVAHPWSVIKTALMNARKQLPTRPGRGLRDTDPYPRLMVAGTTEQAHVAQVILEGLADIEAVNIHGRAAETETLTLPRGHVFNRGLPATASRLFGRQRELNALRQAWGSEQIRILSVVAYGGTGKSALVNAWLDEMRRSNYRGARRVLTWSFYSQGTRENLVSADSFVSSALSWLGDDSVTGLSPWARGLRLAYLIKQYRFLLVLDGMEPLQYPLQAPHVGGQLTDDSIRALLEELVKPDWDGLCLITTRVPLTDLSRFQSGGETMPQGSVRQLDLENLSDADGADLLRQLIRADADSRDLRAAVREVDGHALSITLLGNYLRDVHGGNIAGRYDLDSLTTDARDGGHARRIMASYSRWLQDHERSAELAILRLIGLFDRPAVPEAIQVLLADSRMTPFTGQLEPAGSTEWDTTVGALRAMGLLNSELPEWPGTLDAHPLIREHFRDQLQKEHAEFWIQGNRTLFDYYQAQAPPQPSNAAEMNALYAAVTHGCAAGLHQQVFDEVLVKRIWRDRRTNFSTRRLGMIGADLVALSNYLYPRQWTEFRAPSLTPRARVLVLINAGVRLRQLGRIVDARECFRAVSQEINAKPGHAEDLDLEDASYAAAQYCELLVMAGRLANPADETGSALFNGRRAVEYSAGSKDPYFSMHAHSSLAEVYFMLNDLDQAGSLFEVAMAIERDHHVMPPFLYSQSLFRYGYFLIETDRAREILSKATQDPSWGRNGEDSSLLSEVIRLLILGAARRALIEDGYREPAFVAETEKILNQSASAAQTAGYADYRVRGLIERAHFYRVRGDVKDFAKALADLEKAGVETRRGQMGLFYADVLLQRVACYLGFWPTLTCQEKSAARGVIADALAESADLVSSFGYARRQKMLMELQRSMSEIEAQA